MKYLIKTLNAITAIMVCCLSVITLHAQTTGDYRAAANGPWSTVATWERYNGSAWVTATVAPGSTDDVFIPFGITVSLSANAACNTLNIGKSSVSGAIIGRVALNSRRLNVSGNLRAYTGSIPGTSSAGFEKYPFTSTGGVVRIVGNSRTLTTPNTWGSSVLDPSDGQFDLEINVGAGNTITLGAIIKVSSLTVISGTLFTNDRISAEDGEGPGTITINSGASIISTVTSNNAFQRSIDPDPANEIGGAFTVNGTLELLGADPYIAMNPIDFTGGTVVYNGDAQTLARLGSGSAATGIHNYGDLIINGTSTTSLWNNITVARNLTINNAANLDLGVYTANRTTAGGILSILGTGQLQIGSTNSLPSNYTTYTIDATSTVTYKGSNQQVAAINYGNLALINPGTKTFATGSTGIAGALTITASTLDATTNTTTTIYNGTNAQTVNAVTYYNLTLSSASVAIKRLAAGTIGINGNFTVTGSADLDAITNSPTLSFTGTASQSSTLNAAEDISNINIGNTFATGGVTLAGAMHNVTGSLTFTGATATANIKLTTAGLLTLRSTALGTAWMGSQPTNVLVSGNVTVERYIADVYTRRWHLLTVPVGSTIFNGWQEAGSDNNSYGTFITKPVGTNAYTNTVANDGVNGWDRVSTNLASAGEASSIRAVTAAGTLAEIDNTTSTNFTANPGWFIFVRSARPAGSYNNSLTGATTLRATGAIAHQGGAVNNAVATGTGFVTIKNPYASNTSLTATGNEVPVTASGGTKRFYVWDPAYGGALGGYKLYTTSGSDFTTAASGGALPSSYNNLQSGQAILVPQSATLSGTSSFVEADKSGAAPANVLRNSNTGSTPANSFVIRLQSIDESGVLTERDLTYAEFNNYNSNEFIAGEDVKKMGNFNENLSLKRGGEWIYLEGMKQPLQSDSLHVQLWKTTAQPYTFEIEANGLNSGIQPFLIDKYLTTETPLNASGTSIYSFTSNGNNTDLNRFEIVFRAGSALPVNTTNITAYKQNAGVNVSWTVSNESGMSNYEVEKSTDAISFTGIAALAATNNMNTHTYTVFDPAPSIGYNYYRVKAVGLNAGVTYTSIVKVLTGKESKAGIAVYPNPVKSNVVNVSLVNLAKGNYTIAIYSNDGKQITAKAVTVNAAGAINETIGLPHGTAKGVYRLSVTGVASYNQQIIVE